MDFDPYVNLANAIIEGAAKDYRKVLKALARWPKNQVAQAEKTSLENFFHSQWFELLSDLDGDVLMKQIQKMEGVHSR